ncbi:MAG: SLC13 family permease [Acetobacteraceae bacterium]
MTAGQATILVILGAAIALFLWNRWRHDMVAVAALLAAVAAGLVPAAEAFAGFGHPAVVTVACVLVLSRGLQTSGAVDVLARHALPDGAGPALTVAALAGLGALLSAFMNNVGALALLMPVAIRLAAQHGLPPGRLLMPLAFGSILGGMTTLIGTPPNLIVASFTADAGPGFGMFDFTPVGLAVAAAGVVFIALVGWRLVPAREGAGSEGFDAGAYLTEARIGQDAKAAGMRFAEVERALEAEDVRVLGLVRQEVRVPMPHPGQRLRAGDILLIEAEPDALAAALPRLGLALAETSEAKAAEQKEAGAAPEAARTEGTARLAGGDARRAVPPEPAPSSAPGAGDQAPARDDAAPELVLQEQAVLPASRLVGRSATEIGLRARYGVNLLAVSRQGRRERTRVGRAALRAGDVLLLQGTAEALSRFAGDNGAVPLAERDLRLPDARAILLAGGIFTAAIGAAAFGLVPASIGFAAGVLAALATRVVPPRSAYQAVDWPVIVLLGALIPVAGAMETTGAAELLARSLLDWVARGDAVVALAVVLVVTMTMSDFVNNAATAAVMCPVAMGVAGSLGVAAEPFLMAVAVGASCAFLTPIGHQNNTLILGPGGFRFGDYWRLGLPLEVLVVAVGVPMILLVWPL